MKGIQEGAMSDIRKETVGLGCYSKHAWIDEDPTRLEQCPWCEIERLRAVVDRQRIALNRIAATGHTISEAVVALQRDPSLPEPGIQFPSPAGDWGTITASNFGPIDALVEIRPESEWPQKKWFENPRGHVWLTDQDGDVRWNALDVDEVDSVGIHEGPECTVCGATFCMYCDQDGPPTPCPGAPK